MRYILICLLFLLDASDSFSTGRIFGVIRDSVTHNPLPYTNITIDATYIGTTSNDCGNYSLEIPKVPATIIVSFIGYQTKRITVETTTNLKVDINLQPIVLELERIVIIADREDPAIGIMKKVIKNKMKWRKKLSSFRAKAYTRSRVENDSTIVSMSESLSNIYWDRENGSHETFITKRSSKQMPYLTELNVGSKNILNFLDDDLMLMNHRFVGPTHPNALSYYDFKLTNERYLDNKIVFDIAVRPKSKLQPCFPDKSLFWMTIMP